MARRRTSPQGSPVEARRRAVADAAACLVAFAAVCWILLRLLALHWVGWLPFRFDAGARVLSAETAAANSPRHGIAPGWKLVAVGGNSVANLREAKLALHGAPNPLRLDWIAPDGGKLRMSWDAGTDPRIPRFGDDLRPVGFAPDWAIGGRLTAVNGRSVVSADDPALASAGRSAMNAFDLRAPDGGAVRLVAWRFDRNLPWTLWLAGALVAGLAAGSARLGRDSRTARAFAWFCACVALLFCFRAIPAAYRAPWEREALIALMAFQFVPGVALLAAFTPMRDRLRDSRRPIAWTFASCAALYALYRLTPGMRPFMLVWLGGNFAMLFAFHFSERLARGRGRVGALDAQRGAILRRAMWFSFAPIALFTLARQIDPAFGRGYHHLVELFALVFPLSIAYAVARRNLLDVREYRIEGFAYGGLAAALVAGYVGLTAWAMPAIERWFPGGGLEAQGLLAAAVAVGGFPAARSLHSRLEARFRRGPNRYERLTRELREARTSEAPPERLYALIEEFLPAAALVESVRVLPLKEQEAEWSRHLAERAEGVAREELADRPLLAPEERELLRRMEAASAAWFIPLVVDRRAAGVIALGDRLEGNFTRGDLARLRAAVRECTLALYADAVRQRTREKALAEAALSETRAKFRLFAENARDVIFRFRVHPTPVVEYISPSVASVAGRSPEEFYARPETIFESVDPDDRAILTDLMSAENGGDRLGEVRWIRPDGSRVWLEQRWVPVRDDEGRLIAYEGFARDIGERKRAEIERAALAAQLLQAQKLEALGTLAGGIAHDFGNMLTAIRACVARARIASRDSDALDEALASAEEGLAQAGEVSRGLLTFAGKAPLERRPVDLAAIAEDTLRMLRRAVSTRIEFETDFPPGGMTVEVDPPRMRQVLVNLVLNARDAMPDGGRVAVRGRIEGSWAVLEARDTGIGMEPDTAARIFDPFFTTKPHGQGSGLGLAVAHGIVADHGGAIEVESAPNRGTTFRIRLPAAVAVAPAAQKSRRVRRGGRALLAEDQPMVRAAVAGRLADLGFEVAATANGDECLAAFAENGDYALIALDVELPGRSGVEAIRAIREAGCRAPVLFVTGRADFELPIPGDGAILPKPFSMAAFDAAIAELLADDDTDAKDAAEPA